VIGGRVCSTTVNWTCSLFFTDSKQGLHSLFILSV
jgi:hypothetical protein